jgi:hypothetical protein
MAEVRAQGGVMRRGLTGLGLFWAGFATLALPGWAQAQASECMGITDPIELVDCRKKARAKATSQKAPAAVSRKAPAGKAGEEPSAKPQAEPAPTARQQPASTGVLVLDADAACLMEVEGIPRAKLQPGQPRRLDFQAGSYQLSCRSVEAEEVAVSQEVRLVGGEELAVRVRVLDAMRLRAQEQEALRKEEEAKLVAQTLFVATTDEPCELVVNGRNEGALRPGQEFRVEGEPGAYSGQCMSLRLPPNVMFFKDWKLEAGQTTAFRVQLRAEVDERIAKLQCERNAFELLREPDANLRQCVTGLSWRHADNGADIAYLDAAAHCSARGPGWRLPSVAELKSLHSDRHANAPCGEFACKVSPLFKLSNVWFWSAERVGELEAKVVFLEDGEVLNFRQSASGWGRALCVKSP